MKTIGLLGGTHWTSTIPYYRLLNTLTNQQLGKQHSAKIILNSIDYQEIKKFNYGSWDTIGEIVKEELLKLASFSPDCILICSNILHKAYDIIEPGLELDAPVFHIADCAGEYMEEKGYKRTLFLGTQFIMEDDFYKQRLAEKYGIEILIPSEEERAEIHRIIQEELAKEVVKTASQQWLQDMTKNYPDAESIILACTELPLAIQQQNYDLPVINTLELQCQAAVAFSLS